MINPKSLTTAAAIALVLAMAAPTAGFAEYRGNGAGGVRVNGGYRPPAGFVRPGAAVIAAPAVGGYRAAAPMAQPGAGYRGGFVHGYNGGYRGGDPHHHRGAFVAGAVTGAIIGGALASPGYGYYDGAPVYYAPGYDQYYDGGPAVAPAPAGDDAVAYCMQMFRSYDPQSGTYVGDDGYEHPCP